MLDADNGAERRRTEPNGAELNRVELRAIRWRVFETTEFSWSVCVLSGEYAISISEFRVVHQMNAAERGVALNFETKSNCSTEAAL